MKKQGAAEEDATGTPSPEATVEAKIAWIERSEGALDAPGIAVLREVFPAIMRTYYDRAWRRTLKWGVEPEDAKQILQEVFVELFNHIARDGAQPSLRPVLDRITKGHLLHHRRALQRAPESVALPSSGSALPESEPDLNRAVDYRALAKLLLHELSEARRAVVELCILGEQTEAEAAIALGIPIGTLKSQLRAAKRELRERAGPLLPPSQRKAS